MFLTKYFYNAVLDKHLIEEMLTCEKNKPWTMTLSGILGRQHWQA